MNYLAQIKNLKDVFAAMPPRAVAALPDENPTLYTELLCGDLDLTYGEIGDVCEVIGQIITGELAPEGFLPALQAKLDDPEEIADGEKIAEPVAGAIVQKIFLRLLPALGIKVPIEMAMLGVAKPPVAGAVTERVELEDEVEIREKKPIPLKPISAPPKPLPAAQNKAVPEPKFQAEKPFTSVRVMPEQPRPKPPMVEASHAPMSDNPMESLMKMLDGKVSDKELQKRFEKLPESLRTALRSVDSAKKVLDIGRKYALHVDKIAELGAETGMVILGFTHPGQFLVRLTRRLGLPEENVRPIAQEINTEVFLKIREALKEINGEGMGQSTVRTVPEPARMATPQPPGRDDETVAAISARQMPQPQNTPAGKSGYNSAPPTRALGEEALDREAILRDIENPPPTRFSPPTPTASMPTSKSDAVPPKPVPPSEPATASQTGSTHETTAERKDSLTDVSNLSVAAATERAPESTPAVPVVEQPSTEKPTDIIDQKLSQTTTSGKSESRYSVDPYREPAE